MKKTKILLDNGHGWNTIGKHSPDGRLHEYKYAREVVNELNKRLLQSGYESIIITPEDWDVSLNERVKRINGYIDAFVISIHCNAAGNGRWMNARGWEAYTSPGETESDIIAEYFYNAAKSRLPEGTKIRKDLTDGDQDKEARFYILTRTHCPAILTENLFQDNKEDVDYLLSPKGFDSIVGLHYDAIINYIKERC